MAKDKNEDMVADDADMDRLGQPASGTEEMAHEPITDPAEAQEKGYFGTVSKESEALTEVADLRNSKTYSDHMKSEQGR